MNKKKVSIDKAASEISENYNLYRTPHGELYMKERSDNATELQQINCGNINFAAYKLTRTYFQNKQIEILLKFVSDAAKNKKEPRDVFTRIGFHNDAIYVRLKRKRFVRITAEGIEIVRKSPALFRSHQGMLDLPDPVYDDDSKPYAVFKKLLEVTNFTSEHLHVVVAYIMAAFIKDGMKPVLVLEGPQGSAKSVSLEILLSILDPFGGKLPGLHRSEENLFIFCSNRLFAGFDNVSDFTPQISDVLCRIAHGATFTKRMHYTDGEEFVIYAHPLLALNGISPGLKRADLIDRIIKIELTRVPEGQWKTVVEIKKRFAEIHPQILGWLLRAVQYGLQNPTPLPAGTHTGRMRDFAQWTYQWAPGLGMKPDKLIADIYKNQISSQADAIANDVCADFIFYLLDESDDDAWGGTPSELFQALNFWIDERHGGRRRKGQFPTAPNTLHDWLKRSETLLKTAGISYEKDRGSRQRFIRITRTPKAD
jgi:hypothetical protein